MGTVSICAGGVCKDGAARVRHCKGELSGDKSQFTLVSEGGDGGFRVEFRALMRGGTGLYMAYVLYVLF